MSSRNFKIGATAFVSLLLVGGAAWKFQRETSRVPNVEMAETASRSENGRIPSLNPLFSAPHLTPGKPRIIPRDPDLEANLKDLRETKSRTDVDAFAAERDLQRLDRDKLRALVPELLQIVKENPKSLVFVQSLLMQLNVPPPFRRTLGAEDAGLLMPYLQDATLEVRLAAAHGVAAILRNDSPPEILHVIIQGLASDNEDAIGSSLITLSNMLSDGSGAKFGLDESYYGSDAQEVVLALNRVVGQGPHSNWREYAKKLRDNLSNVEPLSSRP